MQHFNYVNQGKLSLYDCLNYFTQNEVLSGDDQWYCNKCKEHQNASKKMEVYNTPNILVIHLKRFSHTRNSMFGTRKMDELVDFPINGLDMTPFVLN